MKIFFASRRYFAIALVTILFIFLGGCINDIDRCTYEIEKSHKLVALKDTSQYEIDGGGSFFLAIGAFHLKGNVKYYVRYAYKDKFGIRVRTLKSYDLDRVRIKEIDTTEPRVLFMDLKNYIRCMTPPKLIIFEVPKGSVIKDFEIDFE